MIQQSEYRYWFDMFFSLNCFITPLVVFDYSALKKERIEGTNYKSLSTKDLNSFYR